MRGSLGLLALLFVISACESEEPIVSEGGECNVTAPRTCENDTRWPDVEPIFQERCISCHIGAANGPWALSSYSHAASWPEEISNVMKDCSMPPADAGIEMPVEEREMVLEWIRCGSRD